MFVGINRQPEHCQFLNIPNFEVNGGTNSLILDVVSYFLLCGCPSLHNTGISNCVYIFREKQFNIVGVSSNKIKIQMFVYKYLPLQDDPF